MVALSGHGNIIFLGILVIRIRFSIMNSLTSTINNICIQ